MTASRLIWFPFLVILTGILLPGCSQPMTSDTVYDFIIKLPDAEPDYDSFVIDMANPDHFNHLISGWHIPDGKTTPFGRFVWTSETIASVELHAAKKERKELILAVRPYLFEGVPPSGLSLSLNGTDLGRIQLKDEWRTYRLLVPEDIVISGKNELTLRQGQVFRPSDVMIHSDDSRTLGASYLYIVFRTEQVPTQPGFYTIQQTLGARNFIWGGKQRHVVYSEAPSSYSWEITLPSRPVLSFGAGLLPDGFDPEGSDAFFEVAIEDGSGDGTVLFNLNMEPPRRVLEMGWREFSRKLDAFAGQKAILTFRTGVGKDNKGPVNSGSWLEPRLLNRHADKNIIFLPIAGYFDPDSIPLGSGLEKLLFSSLRINGIHHEPLGDAVFSGIPVPLLDLLSREGWPLGYFGTGQSALSYRTHLFSRRLDVMTAYDHAEDAFENCLSDCQDWLKALGERRFVLVFDPRGLDPESQEDCQAAVGSVDWLMGHRYEMDSLIVIFDPEKDAPVWVIDSAGKKPDMERIGEWHSLAGALARVLDLQYDEP